jgi:ABC-2 type transport system permease protein
VQKNAASSLAVVYRNPGMSLFVKEMRILVRTPAFLTNCVAANFVWPAFVLIFAKIMRADLGRMAVSAYFAEPKHQLAALSVILAVTMVTAAMNCLGSDSFSREGKGFDYIKFIPVSYRMQWNVKTAAAMVWTLAGTVPFFALFVIYAKFDVITAVLTVVMVLSSAFFVTELGMLLDSLNPKLFWLDALSALRENYNTVFCMGITIAVCALLTCGIFLMGMPVLSGGIVVLALCAADVVLYMLSMNAGIKNIKQVGE